MKEVQYVPKACQVEGADFTGSVVISLPSQPQRYRYLAECNFQVSGEGKVEADMSQLASVAKVLECAVAHIKAVTIKHKDGTEYKSFEDMLDDPACSDMNLEIAMLVISGFRPGNG